MSQRWKMHRIMALVSVFETSKQEPNPGLDFQGVCAHFARRWPPSCPRP
jgi:hypothetical protein